MLVPRRSCPAMPATWQGGGLKAYSVEAVQDTRCGELIARGMPVPIRSASA